VKRLALYLMAGAETPELAEAAVAGGADLVEIGRLAAAETDGWLYLVTLTGTTGARKTLSPELAPLVERARAVTDVPLLAGFGISTPEQARAAAELADGVVVGSAALLAAEEGARSLEDFVRSLRRGLDQAG
jgi:tryptophan synthase alpha chain